MRACILRTATIAGVLLSMTACASVSTVRLQSDTFAHDKRLRPIAGIQANATTAYLLFLPIPGDVDLDRVVNRMLVVTAKKLGADKIVGLQFDVTPDGGIWSLRKLLGWRSAQASGVAVEVLLPEDIDADQGPEPSAQSEPRTSAPASGTK